MKRKIYLELGITLIVGFLIGFFVNSIVTDKRIKDFSMHKGESSFWRRTLTEVQATEKQKQQIMPIIQEYSEETREILHQSWEQIPSIWEEMEKEIMPYLTEEQQAQIKVIQAKRKKHLQENIKKGNKQRKGPGQGFKGDQRRGPKGGNSPTSKEQKK